MQVELFKLLEGSGNQQRPGPQRRLKVERLSMPTSQDKDGVGRSNQGFGQRLKQSMTLLSRDQRSAGGSSSVFLGTGR
jgi:hypothetical protein